MNAHCSYNKISKINDSSSTKIVIKMNVELSSAFKGNFYIKTIWIPGVYDLFQVVNKMKENITSVSHLLKAKSLQKKCSKVHKSRKRAKYSMVTSLYLQQKGKQCLHLQFWDFIYQGKEMREIEREEIWIWRFLFQLGAPQGHFLANKKESSVFVARSLRAIKQLEHFSSV